MATTIAQVLCLLVGLAAGVLVPRVRGQGLVTRDTWVNLTTGALLFPVRLLLVLLGVNALRGAVPLTAVGHPFLQFLVAFLALDFARYWLHYADHRVPLLWKFHRVHHSVERLDASAGLRMHVVDFLQLTAVPVLLFGVLFDVTRSPGWVIPAALIVGIVADAAEHANVAFPLDTWWRRAWFTCFNNPLFHSWHHTSNGHVVDGNYANALPLWDRLFGTDVTRPEPPACFGIEKDPVEASVAGLQLLRPGVPPAGSGAVRADP
jgi:sterol desaturase/sphingolipid hydroxylase (fatty acid hydroxylase superfamily)